MKKLFFPLTIIVSVLLNACGINVISGSGKIVSSQRAVSGYTRLLFDAPGELTLTQDGKEALSIEGDDNLLGYIKTEVTAGALRIYVVPGVTMLDATQPIRYTLSVKQLDEIALNGSGKIASAGLEAGRFALKLNGSGNLALDKLKVATLDFHLNGSGSLKLAALDAQQASFGMDGSGDVTVDSLSADQVDTTANGSGKYILQGKVTRQGLRILGSGRYDAQRLESRQTEVSVVGSGESRVWATETLSVTILGSGDVGYLGSPRLTQQIGGSGHIYSLQ